jgi:hypothetical protein
MTVQASTGSEALDLDVSCSPMTLEQQLFVIFRLQDISHEKRRRVLERFFFHDVLNTAGVTQNLATLLAGMVPPGDASEFVRSPRLARQVRKAGRRGPVQQESPKFTFRGMNGPLCHS